MSDTNVATTGVATEIAPRSTTLDVELDLVDSFTDLELVEPAPATLDHVPEHRRNVHRDDNALGFLVQHGTTVTPDNPIGVLEGPIGPLPELVRPVSAAPAEESSVTAENSAPPAQSTQPRGIQVRRPSREVPVVLPSPSRSHAPVDADDEHAAPRNSLVVPAVKSATRTDAKPSRPVLLDRPRIRASGGARVWLVVGGGLATLAAAVTWYMMSGAR
jgi:hypothetical protein